MYHAELDSLKNVTNKETSVRSWFLVIKTTMTLQLMTTSQEETIDLESTEGTDVDEL